MGKVYFLNDCTKNIFNNEVRLMRILNHKNLVQYIDSFQNSSLACIVMPKYQNMTIFDYLEQNQGKLMKFI